MIVPADKVGQLRRGTLTTTFAPRQPRTPCPYRVGHTYSVQAGFGQPTFARVEILGVAAAMSDDLDDNVCQAAGFDDAGGWRSHWRFVQHRVPGTPSSAPFAVGEPLWVVWFGVAADEPRLPHRDSSRGYTAQRHMAMRDEPEAVSKETQERFSRDAHERFATDWRERQQEWDRLSLSQQAAELERVVKAAGYGPVRRDLLVARDRLGRARRKLLRDDGEAAA